MCVVSRVYEVGPPVWVSVGYEDIEKVVEKDIYDREAVDEFRGVRAFSVEFRFNLNTMEDVALARYALDTIGECLSHLRS